MIGVENHGIEIRELTLRYRSATSARPDVVALDGVDLLVNPGELFVILGPSGSGKTSLLRCVAGLETPESGEITLNGTMVLSTRGGVSVPPQNRAVGMVFQDFALYPHMTVVENVVFGLRLRRVKAAEIDSRARDALDRVGLASMSNRYPAQLSGGQRQRVALARALVREPDIILFDEPLSNLDPMLRTAIRVELQQLLRRLETTSLFVTHDQEEAMLIADRIAVVRNGRIEQVGTPSEIYDSPATLFVARFTGRPVTNLVEGTVERAAGSPILCPHGSVDGLRLPGTMESFAGQRVVVHVRPEDLRVGTPDGAMSDSRYGTRKVQAVQPEGGHTLVHLANDPLIPLVARVRPDKLDKSWIGRPVSVMFERGTVYSTDPGYLIGSFEA